MFEECEDEKKFLSALTSRARIYADEVKRGETPKPYASFELLTAIFSALEGDISNEKLTSAYPVRAWREDQVPIPRGLLRPLVESWLSYTAAESDGNVSLGEAFDMEPKGQGKRSHLKISKTRDQNRKLSNLVVNEYLWSALTGAPISQDAAMAHVAENEGVTYSKVQSAFKLFGPDTIAKVEDALGKR